MPRVVKKWNITVHFMTDRLYVLRTQQKLSQLNRTRRDDYFSYLGEVLWSTDTCWHPLHRVQITGRRTCSFQCSLLNSRTSSGLETRWQTDHIRVSRSSGRPQTSPRQPIPHSCYGCPSLGMTKILFKIRGSAWCGWQTKSNRLFLLLMLTFHRWRLKELRKIFRNLHDVDLLIRTTTNGSVSRRRYN